MALSELPEGEELLMLNLLKYKENVEATGISGEAAYKAYMQAALPFIKLAGAEVIFFGRPQAMLIGPLGEDLWDDVILVRYPNSTSFLTMVQDKDYPSAMREEALLDSRLVYCKPHTY